MSLSSALSAVFALDRHRARHGSERLQAEENERRASAEAPTNNNEQDVESGTPDIPETLPSQNTADTANTNSRDTVASSERTNQNTESVEEDRNEESDDSSDSLVVEGQSGMDDFANHMARSNTMTLAELEEQRELSRRRSSACVLLAVFVLFRLWIECLQKRDPTLLLLCLLGTSWTVRWIRYNREREEELDRRIEAFLQNNNSNTEVDRNEFVRLSFQAQLALAIMESQRHMMEGGFGRPEGADDSHPGVSDAAKSLWFQYPYKAPSGNGALSKKGDYGALPTKGNLGEIDNHCSICLSEYEDSDMLVRLPCGHVFHHECIQAWTQNHVKCPLCNLDLEEATRAPPQSTADAVARGDSVV